MARWGNARANAYWEYELPPNMEPPESSIDPWIRAKYDRKQYAMKGPIPNPEDISVPNLPAAS
ncbi:SPARC- modular calcium-binding protein 2, partial [Dinochytrium kinnereticum]